MLCAKHSRVVYVYKSLVQRVALLLRVLVRQEEGGRRERQEESSLNKERKHGLVLLTSEQSDFSFQPMATTTGAYFRRAVVIATFAALRKDCRATPSIAFYSGPNVTLASQPRTGESLPPTSNRRRSKRGHFRDLIRDSGHCQTDLRWTARPTTSLTVTCRRIVRSSHSQLSLSRLQSKYFVFAAPQLGFEQQPWTTPILAVKEAEERKVAIEARK
jgi:hypothetical protein